MLVSRNVRYMWIFMGVPWGVKQGGVGKTSYFLALCIDISKVVQDMTNITSLLLIINRKLHMHFHWQQGH